MAPLPRSLTPVLTLALSSCASPSAPEAVGPAEPAPLAEPSPAASLDTCVATGPARPVQLDLGELVTRERGVAWFRATTPTGEALTWLRADGQLGLLELPVPPDREPGGWTLCTPEPGGDLRCFNGPSARANGTWRPLWSVRVTLGDEPELGPLERWADPPRDPLVAAASDGRRAMLVFDDLRWQEPAYARKWSDDPVYRAARVELWDIAEGRTLALDSTPLEGSVVPMAAWCGATRCTLLARHQQGLSARPDARGPTQVVALSSPGDALEVLAVDVVDESTLHEHAQVVTVEDAHVLVTRHANELRLISLDREGEIRGRSSIPIETGGDYIALDEGLLGFRRDWNRHANDWELLTIAADTKLIERVAVSSSAVGIQAARVGAGVIVAGLSGDVSYDEVGDYAFHSWSFEADYRFIAAGQSTEWTNLLGDTTPSLGDGRGGYDLRWLTRPDRAAALLWPTGDAWAGPQLIPVRSPCVRD